MNGSMAIFVYKSWRKNAKTELIARYILSNDDPNKAMNRIVSIMESIIHKRNEIGSNQLIIRSNIALELENTSYKNADNNDYITKSGISYYGEKHEYHSIEQLINVIYADYMIINPTNSLHLITLYEHPSIKSLINRWYH